MTENTIMNAAGSSRFSRRLGSVTVPGLCRVRWVPFFLLMVLTLAGAGFAEERRVNINRAGPEELQRLPYIGEQRAAAIIESRQRLGPFRNVRELVDRRIIGHETFNAISHLVSLYTLPTPVPDRPVSITNIHINGLKGEIFLLENENFMHVLGGKIDQAQESIRIATFLFKTSKNPYNYASLLAEQLMQAKFRGIDVEVVLELSDYNHSLNESNEATLKLLKSAGIKVRFDSVQKQTHTKLAIIDDRFTFIGSHNLSHSALGINNELSLMIDSEDIAAKSTAYFRSIQ